jgi:hypothetical protein
VIARAAAACCAALFLLAVAVQYNDPDPLAWIAIYFAAALASAMTALRRAWWPLPAATAAIALAWAAVLAPRAIGVPLAELTAAWEMQDEAIEIARETYGLLIVAVVCAPLAILQWRRRPGAAASS